MGKKLKIEAFYMKAAGFKTEKKQRQKWANSKNRNKSI